MPPPAADAWLSLMRAARQLNSEISGTPPVDNFVQQPPFLFLTDASNGEAGDEETIFDEKTLYVRYKEDKLKAAKFPVSKQTSSNHFTIIDANEEEALIAVMHTFAESRGDTKIRYTIGMKTQTADATRGLFSETISARDPDEAAALTGLHDFTNVFACPSGGPLNTSRVPAGAAFAVVARRGGDCSFVDKLQLAYEAGAKALVVINTEDTHRLFMDAPASIRSPPPPSFI